MVLYRVVAVTNVASPQQQAKVKKLEATGGRLLETLTEEEQSYDDNNDNDNSNSNGNGNGSSGSGNTNNTTTTTTTNSNNYNGGNGNARERCLKLVLSLSEYPETLKIAFELEPLMWTASQLLNSFINVNATVETRHGVLLLTRNNTIMVNSPPTTTNSSNKSLPIVIEDKESNFDGPIQTSDFVIDEEDMEHFHNPIIID